MVYGEMGPDMVSHHHLRELWGSFAPDVDPGCSCSESSGFAYSSPVAAVTNDHQRSGFIQHTFMVLESGGQKCEMALLRGAVKVWAGLCSSWRLQGRTCLLAFSSTCVFLGSFLHLQSASLRPLLPSSHLCDPAPPASLLQGPL